jgi:GntR family transcriptional regulator
MKVNINKDSPIPYYYQIQQFLKEAIKNGEWKTNDFIPSERELSDLFGVCRMTTRKALDNLILEGVIKKIRGKGTIVNKPKIEGQLLNKLIGTYQDLAEKGLKITTKVITFKEIVPGKQIRKILKISAQDKVFYFERVRFVDEEAYHFSEVYVPVKYCPNLNAKLLSSNSLYKLFNENFGLKPFRVKRTLEAKVANLKVSKYLNISEGAPILFFLGQTYIKDGREVEISNNYIRGDCSKFQIEISMEKIENVEHKMKKTTK